MYMLQEIDTNVSVRVSLLLFELKWPWYKTLHCTLIQRVLDLILVRSVHRLQLSPLPNVKLRKWEK